MKIQSLDKYSQTGHSAVEGWLFELAIAGILSIARFQRERNITGPVCEIGVHHGRLFILLSLLTSPLETSVAYDLFERQSENADESGNGNYDFFIQNCKKHGCDLSRIKAKSVNSIELTAKTITDDSDGVIRLFSIDGGHTSAITQNDLILARAALVDGGVIILDDFFNEPWPGVAEGTFDYLAHHPGTIFPFGIMGNKIFFTTSKTWAADYCAYLVNDLESSHYQSKISQFLDCEVLIFWRPSFTWKRRLIMKIASTPVWKKFQTTSYWKKLRPLVKRYLHWQE